MTTKELLETIMKSRYGEGYDTYYKLSEFLHKAFNQLSEDPDVWDMLENTDLEDLNKKLKHQVNKILDSALKNFEGLSLRNKLEEEERTQAEKKYKEKLNLQEKIKELEKQLSELHKNYLSSPPPHLNIEELQKVVETPINHIKKEIRSLKQKLKDDHGIDLLKYDFDFE